MNMTTINLGRRVFKHGLVFTTTILTCAALHAEDHNIQGSAAEKFVHKAMAGGKMEVQMGRLGQQKGQAQEVKSLGEALVRDHTQANQRLQTIASQKNFTVSTADPSSTITTTTTSAATDPHKETAHAGSDQQLKHDKHQRALSKLQGQSGQEFDKAFVSMAIKHHKKDIAEFERARTELKDQELTSFVEETLPKLRQHLQMAQAAARTVGVDESSITMDVDTDDNSAVGGAAAGTTGTRGSDKPSSPASKPDRDRSSLDRSDRFDGAAATDASGTINQNNPRADVEANIGDSSVSADVDVDRADQSITADVDTDKDGKIFQKGDGKVLGLSTDKNDGKFLGIIPNPRADKNQDNDASIEADVDVDTDDTAVGGSASVESGSSDRNSDRK